MAGSATACTADGMTLVLELQTGLPEPWWVCGSEKGCVASLEHLRGKQQVSGVAMGPAMARKGVTGLATARTPEQVHRSGTRWIVGSCGPYFGPCCGASKTQAEGVGAAALADQAWFEAQGYEKGACHIFESRGGPTSAILKAFRSVPQPESVDKESVTCGSSSYIFGMLTLRWIDPQPPPRIQPPLLNLDPTKPFALISILPNSIPPWPDSMRMSRQTGREKRQGDMLTVTITEDASKTPSNTGFLQLKLKICLLHVTKKGGD